MHLAAAGAIHELQQIERDAVDAGQALPADVEMFIDQPHADGRQAAAIDGKQVIDEIKVAVAISLLEVPNLGDDAIGAALAIGAPDDPLEAIGAIKRAATAREQRHHAFAVGGIERVTIQLIEVPRRHRQRIQIANQGGA